MDVIKKQDGIKKIRHTINRSMSGLQDWLTFTCVWLKKDVSLRNFQ